MNWLNPLVWYASMQAYVKAHFWAFHVSSAWTWISAFGASLAYPAWARDIASMWPVVWDTTKMLAITAKDVAVEFLNTS